MELFFGSKVSGMCSFRIAEVAQMFEPSVDLNARSEAFFTGWIYSKPQTVFSVGLSSGCTKIIPAVVEWIAVNVIDLWRFFAGHPFPYDTVHHQRPTVAYVGCEAINFPLGVASASDRLAYSAALVAEDVWMVFPRQNPCYGIVVEARTKIRSIWQWFGRHSHFIGLNTFQIKEKR
jgi:hypothetical protein